MRHFSVALLLFGRMAGFFLVSPFFSGKNISKSILFATALACSLIFLPSLAVQNTSSIRAPLVLSGYFLLQVAIGYFLGFIFSVVFEAAAFAGEMIGVLMGLSAAELLDPFSIGRIPLMSRFYFLLSFAFLLALDLHHPLLRFLYESFNHVPALISPWSKQGALSAIHAGTILFQCALKLAFLPLLFLLSLITFFALLSRTFPVFWVGFPLQILAGFSALGVSIYFFPTTLQHALNQLWNLISF